MNRFERDKVGLSLDGVRRRLRELAAHGSTACLDRSLLAQLRVLGVVLRPKTPEQFMIRVRIPGGRLTADQMRTLGQIVQAHGGDRADITMRAQLQLRGVHVREVAAVVERLEEAGLASRQTLMDSVRNIRGCALAGLATDAVLDATPVLRELEQLILADERMIDLPKKVNIAVTGCRHQCSHANAQDIALVPASRAGHVGFNVLIGGKIGGMDPRLAMPLNVFTSVGAAATVVCELLRIFEAHGSRETRSKARLAHLVDRWGVLRLRGELERRLGRELAHQGEDLRDEQPCRSVGLIPQRGNVCAAGLAVPVGRITGSQLIELSRLAEQYGRGELRLTGEQNVVIPHIPVARVDDLRREPLLRSLPLDPHPIVAGTQSCTGREFCPLAAIETKQRALEVAEALARRLGPTRPVRIHWSACHAGCGQHAIADIGLVGRRVRVGDRMIDAVDVYINGSDRSLARKVREQVPVNTLVDELVTLINLEPTLSRSA